MFDLFLTALLICVVVLGAPATRNRAQDNPELTEASNSL